MAHVPKKSVEEPLSLNSIESSLKSVVVQHSLDSPKAIPIKH